MLGCNQCDSGVTVDPASKKESDSQVKWSTQGLCSSWFISIRENVHDLRSPENFHADLQQSLQKDKLQLISPEAAVTRLYVCLVKAYLRQCTFLPLYLNTCSHLSRWNPLTVIMSWLHSKILTLFKDPSSGVDFFWNMLYNHSKSISVLEITIETGWQLSVQEEEALMSAWKRCWCDWSNTWTSLPHFQHHGLLALAHTQPFGCRIGWMVSYSTEQYIRHWIIFYQREWDIEALFQIKDHKTKIANLIFL